MARLPCCGVRVFCASSTAAMSSFSASEPSGGGGGTSFVSST